MGQSAANDIPFAYAAKHATPTIIATPGGCVAEWNGMPPLKLTDEERTLIETEKLSIVIAEKVKASMQLKDASVQQVLEIIDVSRASYFRYKKLLTPTPSGRVSLESQSIQDTENQSLGKSHDSLTETMRPVSRKSHTQEMVRNGNYWLIPGWAVYLDCPAHERRFECVRADGSYLQVYIDTGAAYTLVQGQMLPTTHPHHAVLMGLQGWCWLIDHRTRFVSAFVVGGALVQGALFMLGSDRYMAELMMSYVAQIGGVLNVGLSYFATLGAIYMSIDFLFTNRKKHIEC